MGRARSAADCSETNALLPAKRADSDSDSDRLPADGGGGGAAARWRELRLQAGLFVGCLLAGCCIAVMIPFFPLEAARRGLDQASSGLVFSSYALTQLLLFPVAGRLVPALGLCRSFAGGLALAGTTTIVFGLLPAVRSARGFLAASVAMRVAEAAGSTSLQTAARTLAASQFPGRASSALGLVETAIALGMSLGQGLGGTMYALTGYGGPFFLVGGGMVAVALLSSWLLAALAAPAAAAERRAAGQLRRLACSVETWLGAAVVMVVAMNWTAVDPNLAPWVHAELGLSPAALSLYLLGSSGCYSLASLAWGRLADRVRHTYLLTAGCLLAAALGLLLMLPPPQTGLAASPALLAVGMLVRQVAQGGAYVPLVGRLLAAEPDVTGKAAVSSGVGAVFAAGYVVGPVAGGRLADLYGMWCTGAVQAALNVAVAVPVAALAARQLLDGSHRPRQPHGVDTL